LLPKTPKPHQIKLIKMESTILYDFSVLLDKPD